MIVSSPSLRSRSVGWRISPFQRRDISRSRSRPSFPRGQGRDPCRSCAHFITIPAALHRFSCDLGRIFRWGAWVCLTSGRGPSSCKIRGGDHAADRTKGGRLRTRSMRRWAVVMVGSSRGSGCSRFGEHPLSRCTALLRRRSHSRADRKRLRPEVGRAHPLEGGHGTAVYPHPTRPH